MEPNIHDVAKKFGVRSIGLGQMMTELGFVEHIHEDCAKFQERFPSGSPALFQGQKVKVVRMISDDYFPFYRVIFLLNGERMIGKVGPPGGIQWLPDEEH